MSKWMFFCILCIGCFLFTGSGAGAETGRVVEREFSDTMTSGGIGPVMVVVSAGDFLMGDLQGGGYSCERPVHPVSFSKPFAVGKFEITFNDYDQFCSSTGRNCPPDGGKGRQNKPVINASWEDANAYAAWLSAQTDKIYRLPTEAEWEYAARGGTRTARFWGEIDKQACNYANVADLSARQIYPNLIIHQCDDHFPFTAPVGSFQPNAYGLYDMLGNVWEWCLDTFQPDYSSASADGRAKLGWDENRVRRGGSWFSIPRLVRSATRNGNPWGYRENDTGFRLVRELTAAELGSKPASGAWEKRQRSLQ